MSVCVCVCVVKYWSDGSHGYFRSCSRFSKVQAITFFYRVPFAQQCLAVYKCLLIQASVFAYNQCIYINTKNIVGILNEYAS